MTHSLRSFLYWSPKPAIPVSYPVTFFQVMVPIPSDEKRIQDCFRRPPVSATKTLGKCSLKERTRNDLKLSYGNNRWTRMLSLLERPLTDSFTTLPTPWDLCSCPRRMAGLRLPKIRTLLGPLLSGVLVGAVERINHQPDTQLVET